MDCIDDRSICNFNGYIFPNLNYQLNGTKQLEATLPKRTGEKFAADQSNWWRHTATNNCHHQRKAEEARKERLRQINTKKN